MISVVQGSFQSATSIKVCNFTSGGGITLGLASFTDASVEELNIKAVQDISIVQDALKSVKNFGKVNLQTDGSLTCALTSFNYS